MNVSASTDMISPLLLFYMFDILHSLLEFRVTDL